MDIERPTDAFAQPPDWLRDIYKKFQKLKPDELDDEAEIINFNRPFETMEADDRLIPIRWDIKWAFAIDTAYRKFDRCYAKFMKSPSSFDDHSQFQFASQLYAISAVPGLFVAPALIPAVVQSELLSETMHVGLKNPAYNTNIDLHHTRPRSASGTSYEDPFDSPTGVITPKDLNVHKNMSYEQLLDKKLRWLTLGGQYDWTRKVYIGHAQERPAFPGRIRSLLQAIFRSTRPDAAIVNFYNPGDTLGLHRDVTETYSRPLISISIGCDGIFVVGLEMKEGATKPTHAVLRLRSGDVLYMNGPSRWAWHGVPLIIPNTCPQSLKDWPAPPPDLEEMRADDVKYEQWRGWLGKKRVNLNVRQTYET